MYAMLTLSTRPVCTQCTSSTLYIRCELANFSNNMDKSWAQNDTTVFTVRLACAACVQLVNYLI